MEEEFVLTVNANAVLQVSYIGHITREVAMKDQLIPTYSEMRGVWKILKRLCTLHSFIFIIFEC
jgi:hypothetical protein